MVLVVFGVGMVILIESVFSFLGFGFLFDYFIWGKLLFDNISCMLFYFERVIWFGLMISVMVLVVNYVGDGWV